MKKSFTDITRKYLELVGVEKPRFVAERLYLWIHEVPSVDHKISCGRNQSTLESLLSTPDEKEEGEKLVYDIREIFKALRKDPRYVGVLDACYPKDGRYDVRLVLMDDAIIELDVAYFPEVSSSSKVIHIHTHTRESFGRYSGMIKWKTDEFPEDINYYLLTKTTGGRLIEKDLASPRLEVDLGRNYNSDLPLDRIQGIIDSPTPGLIILNGAPGTGKTSFLKYLISKNTSRKWVIIPSKILLGDEGSLVDYLLQNKGNIYILEDCEKVILRRETGNNLEIFLNLTDGLIGDSLCPKFICTFNTPLSNVDPALLRKGRLKLKYEFKPLCLEKTRFHLPEATSPMTLADIYGISEDNGGDRGRRGKVGF